MVDIFFLALVGSLFSCSLAFKDCNASQYDFFSHYSLGKQNQLNSTFQKLNSQLSPLTNITYKPVDSSFTYTIVNGTASFIYLDSKQTADVIGDDIIYIRGGRAETVLSFKWSKNSQSGSGIASCLTDPISFGKLVYESEGFMKFSLKNYIDVSYFSIPCNISRLDPPLDRSDIDILEIILNQNDGSNVKALLQQQIAKYYSKTLNQSLYEERQPISNHSQYTWIDPTPGKSNLTINYTMLPVGCHLQTIGLSLIFVTEITDYSNWKCGSVVPFSPKDIKKYGGIQEYLSISIFQNSIRYAVEKGQLDTILNRQNWQSRVFQFFAGDLYQIIPVLASKYYASQPVTGSCKADTTNLKLVKSTDKNLLLSMHYSCSLQIKSTTISEFEIDPNFVIKIIAKQTQLDFQIVSINKFTHFKDVGEFQIHDLNLATLFLTRSLDRMMEGNVFGSGWQIYPRDYPGIEVENQVLFIYDHIATSTLS